MLTVIASSAAISRRRVSRLPVVEPQPGHAREFFRVVGDEDQIAGPRLPGDKHVVGTDRRTPGSQNGADLAGLLRVLHRVAVDLAVHCDYRMSATGQSA
jgi:hypothetical protein